MSKNRKKKLNKPAFKSLKADQTWCRGCNTTIHIKNIAGRNKLGGPICYFCDDRYHQEGWDHTCLRQQQAKVS